MADTREGAAEPREAVSEPPESEPGPLARLRAFCEERFATGTPPVAGEGLGPGLRQPQVPGTRRQRVQEYRQRLREHRLAAPTQALAEPSRPGQSNWTPLGPSVLLDSQAGTKPGGAGRVMGIAPAAGGQRVYVGAANGGVFRSDNGGQTWLPMMQSFDLQPTTGQSDSLAMGAVAVHPDWPDRVFVGTGEGFGWGPAPDQRDADEFFGVGPVVSEDGGLSWNAEPMYPRDEGSAFFALAVDPADPQRVLGATRKGLYRRQPRNQATAFTPASYKPQDYFLRYKSAAGAVALHYWNVEGQSTTAAWVQGANSWFKDLTLMPCTLERLPFLLCYYEPDGELSIKNFKRDQSMGLIDWNKKDGPLELKVGTGRALVPFELGGDTYLLNYDATGGKARLGRLGVQFASFDPPSYVDFVSHKPVWEKDWTAGFTQLMPFVLEGVPHLLCYTAGSGSATLKRWNGDINTQDLWTNTALGTGLSALVPLTLQGVPCFLSYKTSDGTTTLLRWAPDGTCSPVWTQVLATGLAFMPFVFQGVTHFLAYNATSGATTLSRLNPDASLSNLWLETWETGLRLAPLTMGHEWVPQTSLTPAPTQPTWATSVVAARGGGDTIYYAAFWGGLVYQSLDGGGTWQQVGKSFPAKAGRISLAAQATNPQVLYALIQSGEVYRLDLTDGTWRHVTGGPSYLVGGAPENDPKYGSGQQGFYDLAIAVAPDNVNRIYLGGSTVKSNGEWSGGIYRCEVTVGGVISTSVKMVPTYIGNSVHSDIQTFAFVPGDANRLWVGCDGGAFYTPWAASASVDNLFESRNTGLSTMTVNHLGQHPSEDAVLFCGTQDNGTQRYVGSVAWWLSRGGDGGYPLVANEPSMMGISPGAMTTYTQWTLSMSTTLGNSWSDASVPKTARQDGERLLFYAPLVGTGLGLTPEDRVAFGSVRPWLSNSLGTRWSSLPSGTYATDALRPNLLLPINPATNAPGPGFRIRALAFAGTAGSTVASTLYVGTMNGQVYRYDNIRLKTGVPLPAPYISDAPAEIGDITHGLPWNVPLTDIAVDLADNTGRSIYVTFGGTLPSGAKAHQHVWHFDGTNWQARSGTAGTRGALMNVQHNAIRVDPATPTTLYVGADLGVWRSTDSGANWEPFAYGLPESAVMDLQYFPANGGRGSPALLRASTYGRGVFEMVLSTNAPFTQGVQLYARDTVLDRGLYPTQDGLWNPLDNMQQVNHGDGPDILLAQDANKPSLINFFDFTQVADDSAKLKQQQPARVYVQVSNRGPRPANTVTVMLLLSGNLGAIAPPPPLPAGFENNVQNRTPINTPQWKTLSIVTLSGVRADCPRIASTVIPKDLLPTVGRYCVLALLSHADDLFTNNTQNVDTLCLADRKAVMKLVTTS